MVLMLICLHVRSTVKMNIKLPQEKGREDPILKEAIAPAEASNNAAVFIFVHGHAGIRVEVERIPRRLERVVRICCLVKLNGFVQAVFTDVAPV